MNWTGCKMSCPVLLIALVGPRSSKILQAELRFGKQTLAHTVGRLLHGVWHFLQKVRSLRGLSFMNLRMPGMRNMAGDYRWLCKNIRAAIPIRFGHWSPRSLANPTLAFGNLKRLRVVMAGCQAVTRRDTSTVISLVAPTGASTEKRILPNRLLCTLVGREIMIFPNTPKSGLAVTNSIMVRRMVLERGTTGRITQNIFILKMVTIPKQNVGSSLTIW